MALISPSMINNVRTIAALTSMAAPGSAAGAIARQVNVGATVAAMVARPSVTTPSNDGGSYTTPTTSSSGGMDNNVIRSLESMIIRIETSNKYLRDIAEATSPKYSSNNGILKQESRLFESLSKNFLGKFFMETFGRNMAKNYNNMMKVFGPALQQGSVSNSEILMYKMLGKNPFFKNFFGKIDDLMDGALKQSVPFNEESRMTLVNVIPKKFDALIKLQADEVKLLAQIANVSLGIGANVKGIRVEGNRNNNNHNAMLQRLEREETSRSKTYTKYMQNADVTLKNSLLTVKDINDRMVTFSSALLGILDKPLNLIKKILGYYLRFKIGTAFFKAFMGTSSGQAIKNTAIVKGTTKYINSKTTINKNQVDGVMGVITEWTQALVTGFRESSNSIFKSQWFRQGVSDVFHSLLKGFSSVFTVVFGTLSTIFIARKSLGAIKRSWNKWLQNRADKKAHDEMLRSQGQHVPGVIETARNGITTNVNKIRNAGKDWYGQVVNGTGKPTNQDLRFSRNTAKFLDRTPKADNIYNTSVALRDKYAVQASRNQENIAKAARELRLFNKRLQDREAKSQAVMRNYENAIDQTIQQMQHTKSKKRLGTLQTRLDSLHDLRQTELQKLMQYHDSARTKRTELHDTMAENRNQHGITKRRQAESARLISLLGSLGTLDAAHKDGWDATSRKARVDLIRDIISAASNAGVDDKYVSSLSRYLPENFMINRVRRFLAPTTTSISRNIRTMFRETREEALRLSKAAATKISDAIPTSVKRTFTNITRSVRSTVTKAQETINKTLAEYPMVGKTAGAVGSGARWLGSSIIHPKRTMEAIANSTPGRFVNRTWNVTKTVASGALGIGSSVVGGVTGLIGKMFSGVAAVFPYAQMAIAIVGSIYAGIKTALAFIGKSGGKYTDKKYKDNSVLITDLLTDFAVGAFKKFIKVLGMVFNKNNFQSFAKGIWGAFKNIGSYVAAGLLGGSLSIIDYVINSALGHFHLPKFANIANWAIKMTPAPVQYAWADLQKTFNMGKNTEVNVQKSAMDEAKKQADAQKQADQEQRSLAAQEAIAKNTLTVADYFKPKNLGLSLGYALNKFSGAYKAVVGAAGGDTEKYTTGTTKFFENWKAKGGALKQNVATGFLEAGQGKSLKEIILGSTIQGNKDLQKAVDAGADAANHNTNATNKNSDELVNATKGLGSATNAILEYQKNAADEKKREALLNKPKNQMTYHEKLQREVAAHGFGKPMQYKDLSGNKLVAKLLNESYSNKNLAFSGFFNNDYQKDDYTLSAYLQAINAPASTWTNEKSITYLYNAFRLLNENTNSVKDFQYNFKSAVDFAKKKKDPMAIITYAEEFDKTYGIGKARVAPPVSENTPAAKTPDIRFWHGNNIDINNVDPETRKRILKDLGEHTGDPVSGMTMSREYMEALKQMGDPTYIQQYIDTMLPASGENFKKYHVFPSVMLAQGALESTWGTSKYAVNNNNFFGIKDVPGLPKNSNGFAIFPTKEAGILAHGEFLNRNRRYKAALAQNNPYDQIRLIADAGYDAGDHEAYYNKVANLMENRFIKYDNLNPTPQKPPFKGASSFVLPPDDVLRPWFKPGTNSGTWEHIKHLDPYFLFTLYQYAKALNRPITINSAWRSREEQERLYKAKGGVGVAKPGGSNHERGLAVDIDSHDGSISAPLLKQFNLIRPVSNEAWHVEMSPAALAARRLANAGSGSATSVSNGRVDTESGASGTPFDQIDQFFDTLTTMLTGTVQGFNDPTTLGTNAKQAGGSEASTPKKPATPNIPNAGKANTNTSTGAIKFADKKKIGDPVPGMTLTPEMMNALGYSGSLPIPPVVKHTTSIPVLHKKKDKPLNIYKTQSSSPIIIKIDTSSLDDIGKSIESIVQNIDTKPLEDISKQFEVMAEKSTSNKGKGNLVFNDAKLKHYADMISTGEVQTEFSKIKGNAEIVAAHSEQQVKAMSHEMKKPLEVATKTMTDILGKAADSLFKPLFNVGTPSRSTSITTSTPISNNSNVTNNINSGSGNNDDFGRNINQQDLGLSAFAV